MSAIAIWGAHVLGHDEQSAGAIRDDVASRELDAQRDVIEVNPDQTKGQHTPIAVISERIAKDGSIKTVCEVRVEADPGATVSIRQITIPASGPATPIDSTELVGPDGTVVTEIGNISSRTIIVVTDQEGFYSPTRVEITSLKDVSGVNVVAPPNVSRTVCGPTL